MVNDEKNVVEIDNSKCIACGSCISECHHGSRYFDDDCERFFTDLKQGVQISVIAAPAVKTNFAEWGCMFTWLRSLGVRFIYDVSLGADICSWAHIRYIQKYNPGPVITQPCPAIVNYILLHRNELARYLSPIHSPMLCTAVYMRKNDKINTRIAALSPCIGKSYEFEATRQVDYNVTFKSLCLYIQEHRIEFPQKPSGFDNSEPGLGSLYPAPGGLKENVEYHLGKTLRIDKSEGQKIVYKDLDEYSIQPEDKLPALFDVLNCPEGCNKGNGIINQKGIFEINTVTDNIRQDAVQTDKRRYLNDLFEKFDLTLRLQDFIRKYVLTPVRSIKITNDDINKAFEALGKDNESSMTFDCGACGCDSCYDMAVKIAKKINTPKNCVDKSHNDIYQNLMDAKYNLSQFKTILDDSENIKTMTGNIVSQITNISDILISYKNTISDIENVSKQINIIAFNASIEAARAGIQGKPFKVIADEIRVLAQGTKKSAEQTMVYSKKAAEVIENVNKMILTINENANNSHSNIMNISENTKKVLKVV